MCLKRSLWLCCLILASCATTPPLDLERAYPVEGLGIRAEGVIAVLDRTRLEGAPSREEPVLPSLAAEDGDRLVLKTEVTRVLPRIIIAYLIEGKTRLIRLNAELSRGERREPLILDMRYTIKEIDQVLVPSHLPTNLELQPLNRRDFYCRKKTLPFILTRGIWEWQDVRVLCTRDYPRIDKDPYFGESRIDLLRRYSPGETSDSWYAFLASNQKFQIVSEDDRVLGEIEGGRYRIFDTVAEEDIPSFANVLGVVLLTHWFSNNVQNYRTSWGPEPRTDANGNIKGNYMDFPHHFVD